MIPTKVRESSRRVASKATKLPKNLERIYKEKKCRGCAVVVTRMDFAKILGKFTKVKIQYESSTTPKTTEHKEITSPNSNARLKRNENGMVLLHRKVYNEHPVKDITPHKKGKNATSRSSTVSPPLTPNILKENNRLKKSNVKDKNANYNDNKKKNNYKQYGIIFEDPLKCDNSNSDINSKISLPDLLSKINESILPTEDWCIDFFPKKGELKDDKVYDRIAAELEDLMFSEKSDKSEEKVDTVETKVDDFPSIMDILNDNSSENKTSDQTSALEFKSHLESSDVEAMLLGKSNSTQVSVVAPMDVDNSDMGNLIEDVNQLTAVQDTPIISEPASKLTASAIDIPQSPSLLDETLQKGIEEHLPCNPAKTDMLSENDKPVTETKENIDESDDPMQDPKELETIIDDKVSESEPIKISEPADVKSEPEDVKISESGDVNISESGDVNMSESEAVKTSESEDVNISESKAVTTSESEPIHVKELIPLASREGITHLVFKKTKDDTCIKSVTCPKNLKYEIEIDGKSVELIGAPKFISSLEDLQVLLQIVNESNLNNLYVLH